MAAQPTPRRALTRESVAAVVAESFFAGHEPLCGVELEWPVHRRGDVGTRPSAAQLLAVTTPRLPRGSRVTVEPGGQVELSTVPAATADGALDAATVDTAALHDRLDGSGLVAVHRAVDARRARRASSTRRATGAWGATSPRVATPGRG